MGKVASRAQLQPNFNGILIELLDSDRSCGWRDTRRFRNTFAQRNARCGERNDVGCRVSASQDAGRGGRGVVVDGEATKASSPARSFMAFRISQWSRSLRLKKFTYRWSNSSSVSLGPSWDARVHCVPATTAVGARGTIALRAAEATRVATTRNISFSARNPRTRNACVDRRIICLLRKPATAEVDRAPKFTARPTRWRDPLPAASLRVFSNPLESARVIGDQELEVDRSDNDRSVSF